jgi:hypothetical protein
MSSFEERETSYYTREEMKQALLGYITCFDAPKIKEIIFREIKADKKTKEIIYKRILKAKLNQDWWDFEISKKLAVELTHIFKLCIELMAGYFAVIEGGLEGEAFGELERLEADLEAEKINEQQYIERCNFVRDKKDSEEHLLSLCVSECSVMGLMNPAIKENADGSRTNILVFKVMCVPRGWSGAFVL